MMPMSLGAVGRNKVFQSKRSMGKVFITPIGIAMIVLGLLMGFGINFTESFVIALIAALLSYIVVARYIKKDVKDAGKGKYTFELRGSAERLLKLVRITT